MAQSKFKCEGNLLRGMGYGFLFVSPFWVTVILIAFNAS